MIILLLAIVMVLGCSKSGDLGTDEEQSPAQDVIVTARATKIAQLVGEYDREQEQPTINLTERFANLMSQTQGRLQWYCETPKPQNPFA